MSNEEDIQYLKKFGNNLKRVRTLKGLTQQNLADILEVEISQISRIERGLINTSLLNIKNLARGLNVEVADLFKFS